MNKELRRSGRNPSNHVVSYNIDGAFRNLKVGINPFERFKDSEHSVPDNIVNMEEFSTPPRGGANLQDEDNLSSVSSSFSSRSALDDRLKKNPDEFKLIVRAISNKLLRICSKGSISNAPLIEVSHAKNRLSSLKRKILAYQSCLDNTEDLSLPEEEYNELSDKVEEVILAVHKKEEEITSRLRILYESMPSTPETVIDRTEPAPSRPDIPGHKPFTPPVRLEPIQTLDKSKEIQGSENVPVAGVFVPIRNPPITQARASVYVEPIIEVVPSNDLSPKSGRGLPTWNTIQPSTVRNTPQPSVSIPEQQDEAPVIDLSKLTLSSAIPTPRNMEEKVLAELLTKIEKIIRTPLSDTLSEIEISGLETRQKVELVKLREKLTDKLFLLEKKELDTVGTAYYSLCLKSFDLSGEWIDRIQDIYNSKELYSNGKSLGIPLKVNKFDGWNSAESVFEFLDLFSILARHLNSVDRAEYLFNNYLSADLQRVCQHIRHNFSEMKSLLLRRYGEPNRIIDRKREEIKRLSIPNGKDKQAELNYFRQLTEILNQTISMVSSQKNHPELSYEIYSYGFVSDIVKTLPDFMKSKYSKECISFSDRECNGREINGRESFNILMKLVSCEYRSLEMMREKFGKPETLLAKPSNPNSTGKSTSKNNSAYFTKPSNSKHPSQGWVPSVCFMHSELKRKIVDCKLGECAKFLNGTPEFRKKQAIKHNLCICCFTYRCKRQSSNGSCVFKQEIPLQLVCQLCLHKKIDCNVLLCKEHVTDLNDVREPLTKFLPGYESGSNIVLTMSVLKMSSSKSLKKCQGQVFNTSDGTVIPRQNISHLVRPSVEQDSLYLMQVLSFNGSNCLTLYDTGASGCAVRGMFALNNKFEVVNPEPQFIAVAGGRKFPTGHGVYGCTIGPLPDGTFQNIDMIGLEQVTGPIPAYDLTDITKEVQADLVSSLISKDKFPSVVGGTAVDLIIGINQTALMPTHLFTLPSGVQVYRSALTDVFGSNLILAGPHHSITRMNKDNGISLNNLEVLFTNDFSRFRNTVDLVDPLPLSVPLNPCFSPVEPTSIEGCSNKNIENLVEFSCANKASSLLKIKRKPKLLEEQLKEEESTGNGVDYRCPSCVNCRTCLESDRNRIVSVQEELEEAIIDKCVKLDLENQQVVARLPFKCDPIPILTKFWGGSDNKKQAKRVYDQQCKKPADVKSATIAFHDELVAKGYVKPLKELPKSTQEAILNAPIRHYMTWRSVFKMDSVSTPCRIVCDTTCSGLNSVLCKGNNILNNMYGLGICWRSNAHAFTADISKMYNSVKLDESELNYMLYLWSPNLDPGEEPELYLYTTITYGIICSGNIVTAALRGTALSQKDKYPNAAEIICKHCYMDDIGAGANDLSQREKMIAEIEKVLPCGGFQLKVVCRSGEAPPAKASNDGSHSSFIGYKWDSEHDLLTLGDNEINFNKKSRGVKAPNTEPIDTVEKVEVLVSTVKLTRRMVLGKTMELFDLLGLTEPLKAKLKLDLKLLNSFDYDEVLPPTLQVLWKENIKLIHDARKLKFHRNFFPKNAGNVKFDLIACCDAAVDLCGCVVYCRTQCADGTVITRIVTARTKSVSGTIPRNELCSIVLGAETIFCILKLLKGKVNNYYLFTDSEISLAWISNPSKPLKEYVFNRVSHLRRLVNYENIFHIPGEVNPADCLTKGKCNLNDMDLDKDWQTGPNWLKQEISDWPMTSFEEIRGRLVPDQIAGVEKEMLKIPEFNLIRNERNFCVVFECFCTSPKHLCHCQESFEICCHCKIDEFCTISENILENVQITKDFKSEGLSLSNLLTQTFTYVNSNNPDLCTELANGLNTVNVDIDIEDFSKDSIFKLCTVQNMENKDKFLVDFVKLGFKKSFKVLIYVLKFINNIIHKLHESKGSSKEKCQICKTFAKIELLPEFLETPGSFQSAGGGRGCFSPFDKHQAWKFLIKKATIEYKSLTKGKSHKNLVESDEGILYSGGRMAHPIQSSGLMFRPRFVMPVAHITSDLVYSVVMFLHDSLHHPGTEKLVHAVSQVLYVENLRTICKAIRKSCLRCRYLQKRAMIAESGMQSELAFTPAPPFYSMQIDVCCGFLAYDMTRPRVTKAAYFLVGVCILTSAVSIGVLEDLTVESIIMALTRHACHFGWPKNLLPDMQSSFVKLEDLRVSFRDLQNRLFSEQSVILDFCTPLMHASHGKIEARIKLIKELLEKTGAAGFKHSFLHWETILKAISSILNSFPIAKAGDNRNPNNPDNGFSVITPHHFLIGHNDSRSLEGEIKIMESRSSLLEKVNETYRFLQEILVSNIHRFIPGRQVNNPDPPSVGDLVIFVHKDNLRSRNIEWKFGKIVEVTVEGRKSKVRIEYNNHNEVVKRRVLRHLSHVTLLKRMEELDFNTRSHKMALEHQFK